MVGQLAPCHPTQGMDEVPPIEIWEPILVRVVRVETQEEIMSGGVFHSILVTGILNRKDQNMCNDDDKGLTRYSSSLYMNGVMAWF